MGCSREYTSDPRTTDKYAVEIVCDPWYAVESIGIKTRCLSGHFVFYRFEKFDLKKKIEQQIFYFIFQHRKNTTDMRC